MCQFQIWLKKAELEKFKTFLLTITLFKYLISFVCHFQFFEEYIWIMNVVEFIK
jgi:hypothetical protein